MGLDRFRIRCPRVVSTQSAGVAKILFANFHQNGRWLFDDVDVEKLRAYICENETQVAETLGQDNVFRLHSFVDKLDENQNHWKKRNRTNSSIEYFRTAGRITSVDARFYKAHVRQWYVRLTIFCVFAILGKIGRTACQLFSRSFIEKFFRFIKASAQFVVSERYRQRASRRLAIWRIRSWKNRRFLRHADAQMLRRELRNDTATRCITDFGVHLAIKPICKILQWVVLPVLCVLGILSLPTTAIIIAAGGAIGRTLYSLYRCIVSVARREPAPWIALSIGMIPVVGNAAFPTQFIFWCRNERRSLPRFLLFDTFAGFGRAIPIWGAADSLVEARVNRLPNLFFRWLRVPGD